MGKLSLNIYRIRMYDLMNLAITLSLLIFVIFITVLSNGEYIQDNFVIINFVIINC